MKRSQRLHEIGQQTALPQDALPARDVLYHFCCDAVHLCDWIAATLGTDKASSKAIADRLTNDVIKPSPELSACRDIANGFKHLVVHSKSYLTDTTQGHSEVVSHSINIGAPPMRAFVNREQAAPPATEQGWEQDTFKIDIKGHQHDAQDVATKAVAAWDQWLNGPSQLASQLRNIVV
jgi:hypothetical protein